MDPLFRNPYRDFCTSARPVAKIMDEINRLAVQALKSRDTMARNNAIQCASIVILSGYLESNLKTNAEMFFTVLDKKKCLTTQLPAAYLELHYRAGAKMLAKVSQAEAKKNMGFAETETFVKRLAAPAQSGSHLPLWEAFAETSGNPGPTVIKDYLKRFDIQDPMRAVAVKLRGIYSASVLESKLQSFIDIRNECAHTGSAKSIPLPSDVRDYVTFLRYLTLGIARTLDDRAKQI